MWEPGGMGMRGVTFDTLLVVATGLVGRWRIEEMELWDRDAIELCGPGFVEFNANGSGRFGFIAVEGALDGRFSEHEGRPRIEFSWDGFDECDQTSGRGWADLMADGSLQGRFFIHLGDDSAFRASRWD